MKAGTGQRRRATAVIGSLLLSAASLARPGVDAAAPTPAPAPAQVKPASPPDGRPRRPGKTQPAPARKRASALDLSIPEQAHRKPATPEDPNYTASELRHSESGVEARAAADRTEGHYRTEPLFESEQRLQILDTEVPVSVKLGRWKTPEQLKALGLSATVPLAGRE